MRSIMTVTTPPERVALTTLERVKSELGITSAVTDDLLEAKILEASSDIESKLGRSLARAGITERFWGEPGATEFFSLDRYPVATVTSVTIDDTVIGGGEVLLDPGTGLIYRVDASGHACLFTWCKNVIVVYTGGYELPGASQPDLPPALEAAAIELMTQYWTSRGRDPSIRSEDIPGIGSWQYWVGAVGAAGELPPSVMSKISPFRRPQV